MGFTSFNERYFRRELGALERRPDVYHARQLLKVLDDLADEGYPQLGERMERDFGCVYSRRYEDLRRFETLVSQDVLMQYAGFGDGVFRVRVAEDEWVRDGAMAEIGVVVRACKG